MSASAAIADPLLRRAFGRPARPSDPQRAVSSTRRSFAAPRACLALPLSPSPMLQGREDGGRL